MRLGSLFPRMVSYAGNHEDVLLRRAFPDSSAGFYIDVGAHHPSIGSITKHFSDRGWQGINVEPLPSLFCAFPNERPHDINLNIAVSDVCGRMMFYEVADDVSLSTLSRQQADEYVSEGRDVRPHDVELATLASICERYVQRTIEFLSIDVEGHEYAVLRGADFSRWRPKVVMVEAVKPWSTTTTHEEWEHVLLDAQYSYALFDGVNRFYVRNENSELLPLLSTPANIIDNYVEEKIIAMEKELERYRASLDHPTNFWWWLKLPGRISRKISRIAAR